MIRSRRRRLFIAVWMTLSFAIPITAAAESPEDIVVFVHQGSPVKSVSVAELKQLFLKKRASWSSGQSVIVINAPSGSAVRNQFRKAVLGMSEAEEATHWETARIRNQIAEPAEMLNTAKAVFRLKNAVSYAFRKDVPQGVVEVVLVIPKGNTP